LLFIFQRTSAKKTTVDAAKTPNARIPGLVQYVTARWDLRVTEKPAQASVYVIYWARSFSRPGVTGHHARV